MNKTEVKTFFTKPIGDVFKINFENHNRVPQESLYHYVIETLREELDTYTTKEVVQLKNL